jgi:hypothetical protein
MAIYRSRLPLSAVVLFCALPALADAEVIYIHPGPELVSDNNAFPLPGLSLSRGATATGTLYFKFTVTRPASNQDTENYYAGLSFYDQGNEHLGIGNGWTPDAYSAFGSNGDRNLNSATPEPGQTYQRVRATDTTTFIIRVNFNSGADDNITVWLNPNLALSEAAQEPALTTTFTANADFDTIHLREGGNNGAGWTFSDIAIAENPTDAGFFGPGSGGSSAAPVSAGTESYHPWMGGSQLVTVIGHKAQSKAPLIDEQGRMLLRANGITVDRFGLLAARQGRIDWTYDEGYLPSTIHDFDIPNFRVRLRYFCHPRAITSIGQWNGDFVLAYARATLTYTGSDTSGTLPVTIAPPPQLTPINAAAISAGNNPVNYDIASNTPLVLDYAVATERISGAGGNTLNSSEIQEIAGDFDAVEADFKAFWKTEVDRLVSYVIPPTVQNATHLSNAQKTALVHMQVIRVGNAIHIGKNGYDNVYDHDAQGILASAMELGALTPEEAEALLRNLPAQMVTHDYIDALGKLPWAHAKFCQKFSPSPELVYDLVFVQPHAGYGGSRTVSGWVHYMVENKLQADGLAVPANTLDSYSRSTVDNCAVVLGLKAYAYLCMKAGNTSEYNWAENQYNTTISILQNRLLSMAQIKPADQRYISAGVDSLTENITNFTFGNTASAFTNANAYSHFFFGRMFELELLGGSYQWLKPYIDNTLDYGLSQVSGDSRIMQNGQWTGNFGVFDNSHYSNGYNASFCEGLMLGNGKYRDAFFKSFDFLMGCQTGPYCWFEGIRAPQDHGVNIQGRTTGAVPGTGSAPHVWSSMSQARMMNLAFISEKYDGSLILARGLPTDWFDQGEVGVNNYKLSDTSRFAYSIKPTANSQEYELTYTGQPLGPLVLNPIMFTNKTPRLIQFPGAGGDYLTKVALTDHDADGKQEIVIAPDYTGGKVVFSMTDAPPSVPDNPRIDHDGDGISDIWAALYPGPGGPDDDPDGDGQTNSAEAMAGTDPFGSASRFAATTTLEESGDLMVNWPGVTGKSYSLETSTDLEFWTPLPGQYTGAGVPLSAMVRPVGSTEPRLFWRVAAKDVDSDGNGLNDWEQAQTSAYVVVTATAGANGSISPGGTVYRAKGGSLTFTITPAPNHVVDAVLVDGSDVGAVSSYTFSNLQSGSNINVSFRSTGFLEASPSAIVFPRTGGTENVSLSSSGPWAATSSATWLTLTPLSYSGTTVLVLTAGENSSLARSATVYLQSGGLSRQITVTQANGPTFAIRNRSQGTYMVDAGDLVGEASSVVDSNHLWVFEDLGNGLREIRNFGTGDYIHIENNLAWAQCTPRIFGWWSSQWNEEIADGYLLFRNRWQSSNYLHVGTPSGDVRQGSVDPDSPDAQWELIETP